MNSEMSVKEISQMINQVFFETMDKLSIKRSLEICNQLSEMSASAVFADWSDSHKQELKIADDMASHLPIASYVDEMIRILDASGVVSSKDWMEVSLCFHNKALEYYSSIPELAPIVAVTHEYQTAIRDAIYDRYTKSLD